jgi:glycosyltransferase involved in cell wall biosynthesis
MAPGALPIIAAKLAGKNRILATVHQPYTPAHGRWAKTTLKCAARLCSHFICVSKNAEISWFGSGSIFNGNLPLQHRTRHFTIYNAVDVDLLQQILAETDTLQLREALGIETGKIVVGAVSRLRHEKGIDLLVEGFALAVKDQPNMHLVIVGSGPDDQRLKALATERSIGQQCTFYGEANWQSAMEQMAIMDVVVVPSRFEGFGLAAAEAMAMRKAVVACKVDGLAEVVDHEVNGLLFEKEDHKQLAKQLTTLATTPLLRQTLGAAAKQKAETVFSLENFGRNTRRLYEMLSS